jgi:prephenate dehydrogenase
MSKTICIVGLGLMGASLAGALKGFEDYHIIGVDANPAVCAEAKNRGYIEESFVEIENAAPKADIIIFCVYARHIPTLLKKAKPFLKDSSLISDICGVKTSLYDEILPLLPENCRHIGLHPMAGREKDGIANADPSLYKGSNMLLVPTAKTTEADLSLMEALAQHIGCFNIKTAAPAAHDAIIAYTSDLMHLSAAALCLPKPNDFDLAFTAGAFRDCTRVANINADAWTELCFENQKNTLEVLNAHIDALTQIRTSLENNNSPALRALLQTAGDNKRRALCL